MYPSQLEAALPYPSYRSSLAVGGMDFTPFPLLIQSKVNKRHLPVIFHDVALKMAEWKADPDTD